MTLGTASGGGLWSPAHTGLANRTRFARPLQRWELTTLTVSHQAATMRRNPRACRCVWIAWLTSSAWVIGSM